MELNIIPMDTRSNYCLGLYQGGLEVIQPHKNPLLFQDPFLSNIYLYSCHMKGKPIHLPKYTTAGRRAIINISIYKNQDHVYVGACTSNSTINSNLLAMIFRIHAPLNQLLHEDKRQSNFKNQLQQKEQYTLSTSS